ncbi:membrane-associated protein [Streptomyces sp. yr375]|uniref:DedA family protein n=1 Tax=Streptomyces sp. yr375 TaxID=1761906 RepID=UPI0008BD495B|nr:VTT domain-containing protein [Streptomyces sp. yr375]SES18657.1 membrane-associated protein [Streptomyces sp. yr375]
MTTLALGPEWITPDYLISTFGLVGILVIVFAESGLFAFLPGDSLLFTAGLLVADGKWISQPLWLVCTLIVIAAVLGDQVGYLIGKFFGPKLFNRPNSKLFKQENLEKAHEFMEKFGPKAIVLARFVPIVRTFAPIVAGAGRMKYRTFITYNVVGGILWGTGVTVAGYFLGQIDFIKSNVEAILVLIVVLSVVPVIFEILKARKEARNAPAQPQQPQHPHQQQPPAMDDATTQLRRIEEPTPYGHPDQHQGHHNQGHQNDYYGQQQYPQQQPYPQEWQQQPQPQQQPYGAQHNSQYPPYNQNQNQGY